MDTPEAPSFPPLLRGEPAGAGHDPFAKAISLATLGTDAGLVVYDLGPEVLRAAMVFAPECPLQDAMAMVMALEIGFADALGALAPPEVGVHFDWPDGLRVNGARCGRVRAAAATRDPAAEPDWLVVGLEVPFTSQNTDPGTQPNNTALHEEGCAEITPTRLLESWARHALVWINRWSDDGLAPLHADWRSRAFSLGEEVTVSLGGVSRSGTFMGLDERGGLLLRNKGQTMLVPLVEMLE